MESCLVSSNLSYLEGKKHMHIQGTYDGLEGHAPRHCFSGVILAKFPATKVQFCVVV